MALRDPTTSNPKCGLTNTTYWYDDPIAPNLKLPVLQLYGKWKVCRDQTTTTAPRCISTEWVDRPCDESVTFPLCMFSSRFIMSRLSAQKYRVSIGFRSSPRFHIDQSLHDGNSNYAILG